MKTVSFKVEDEVYFMIDFYARKLKIPKSEFMRRAVKHYIKTLGSHVDKPFVTRRMKIYT